MKFPKSFCFVFALAVVSTAGLPHAQTRTWSFSKDTVYEWRAQGDSVLLTNSGIDSLRFDSVAFELIAPSDNQYQALFQSNQGSAVSGLIIGTSSGQTRYFSPQTGPKNWSLAPAQSVKLWSFNGNHSVLQVVKRAAIAQNDTVLTRFIFIASAGRGRDTLMFFSKQDGPTALRVGIKAASSKVSGVSYDLRGRLQDKATKGVRIPFRAIVTNEK